MHNSRIKYWDQPSPTELRSYSWHPKPHQFDLSPNLWERFEIIRYVISYYQEGTYFADENRGCWTGWIPNKLYDRLPVGLLNTLTDLQSWCILVKAVSCIWFDLDLGQADDNRIAYPLAAYKVKQCSTFDGSYFQWIEIGVGIGWFNWTWYKYDEDSE